MRRPARFLSCVVLLSLPGVAWAGGTAVVAPLVASGVDAKVSNNITSLISSELDFSGAYDTVNEIKAPSTLNSSCLTSTSCLGGIAKANEGDALVTGSVAPGGAGLKINLVLYDAKKNAIVRKKSYDLPADVGTLASSAPKMVKEILGQGAALAEAEEESAAANVFEEEDEGDDFDMEGSDIKGKTRFTPGAKKGKLEDTRDEEDEAEDEAKAAAAAKAKAKADAEDRARREAEAKAKARAEAEAKAKAEAEAKAKAEAEERARREAEAKAKARAEAEAKAKAEAEAKAKSKKSSKSAEDEELEEELANFSFGGGGKVAEDEEEAAEEEEEEKRDTRSFSERYASSTPSKSKAKVEEREEEEEEEEEEDEAPRASTKSKSTAKAKVEEEDEEEEEEETPRFSSRKSSDEDEEEEEEEAPRASSRKTSDDEEEEDTPRFSSKTKSKSTADEDEEEEDTPRFSSRSKSSDDEDEDEPPKRSRSRDDDLDRPSAQIDEDAKAKFGVLLRGGYAHFGTLDFVTYGAELEIPVASRVVILAGVEGASTNRNYTDEERKVIADAAGILPEQVQDWNAILPIDVGVVYKVPVSNIQPYIGADFLAVAYTAELDFAFGGRVRGGCDFMISENFGFNVDAGVGVLAGDKFDLIQKDLAEVGLYPEISAGTVLAF